MTREMIAAQLYWPYVACAAGTINAGAMIPQIVKLLRTRQTEGVSVAMFWIYFIVQMTFAIDGYFHHDDILMWSLTAAAAVSASNLFLVHIFRADERRREAKRK